MGAQAMEQGSKVTCVFGAGVWVITHDLGRGFYEIRQGNVSTHAYARHLQGVA